MTSDFDYITPPFAASARLDPWPLGAKIFKAEVLEKAHQILDGIPGRHFYLDTFYSNHTREVLVETDGNKPLATKRLKECGTIACGAGWLSLHPYFNSRGVYPNVNAWSAEPINMITGESGYDALSDIFVLDNVEVHSLPYPMAVLFAGYGCGAWDEYLTRILRIPRMDQVPGAQDKALLLARLRYAYHYHSK